MIPDEVWFLIIMICLGAVTGLVIRAAILGRQRGRVYERRVPTEKKPVIVTTDEFVPGHQITKTLGVIKAENVILSTVGGGRKTAENKLASKASRMGADAVVGVTFRTKGMDTSVEVMGTAVKLGKRAKKR